MGLESLPFQYQKRKFWEYYCPVCKSLSRSFYWPSPRPQHYLGLAVFEVFLTAFTWPWFGPKGAFLIFPIWALFEASYRMRARQSIICRHCGFDPYLYKFDVKLARQKMEEFWAEKVKKQGQPAPSVAAAPLSEKN